MSSPWMRLRRGKQCLLQMPATRGLSLLQRPAPTLASTQSSVHSGGHSAASSFAATRLSRVVRWWMTALQMTASRTDRGGQPAVAVWWPGPGLSAEMLVVHAADVD